MNLHVFLFMSLTYGFVQDNQKAEATEMSDLILDSNSNEDFWLKRDSIKRIRKPRKFLKHLIHQRRKKALRRKQLLRNQILTQDLLDYEETRPNIILILTDDQDTELGSLQYMPKLKKYLMDEGAEFKNGFTTTPMCCPSRSSILTGLYSHNHHVLTNNDNRSSTEWVQQHEPRSFAKYLHDAGYTTGYFGKYLNKYNGNHIPVGYDEWFGLIRNSRFYNYTVNSNGKKIKHGWDYAKDYFPDLITNDSIAFFRESKKRNPEKPVMMVMSYPAPHGPEDAAPQYSELFFNVTSHHTPAYDWAPNPDKQWILQVTDRMEPIHKKFTDILMTKRLQTLQSVDDGIERLHQELEALEELDNTYIFYTSDHGYHLGQFGLVKGKAFAFDVDTKIPYIVRGPKVRAGSIYHQPVLNIDLAPTFLDIGGVAHPAHMDGKSIVPLFHESDDVTVDPVPSWRQAFLIERGKMTEERWAKIRSSIEHLTNITNSNSSKPFVKKLTTQEILAVECLKPKFQAPCQMYQKFKCVLNKKGLWKISACRDRELKQQQHFDEKNNNGPGNDCDCFEKRLQRKFLNKHTNAKFKASQFIHERQRRNAEELKTVLKEIAADEIDEVDSIMEDITDEILDLQQSINVTGVPCTISNTNQVNCSSNVYKDRSAWKSSRAYVNEQIRRLRSRLHELKEIRNHLRYKRPGHLQDIIDSEQDFEVHPGNVIEYPAEIDMEDLAKDEKEVEDLLDIDEVLQDVINETMESTKKCNCKGKRNRSLLRNLRKTRRQKVRLQRMRQRLLRKLQRSKSKHFSKKKKADTECSPDERLNCFSHDNDHWKTAPFWNDGPFCACTNSNTNTYSCVRNVNTTHNYLYCEHVSGLITYYNLNVDPFQLRNIYLTLSTEELNFMHHQLAVLKNQGLAYSRNYGNRAAARQRSFVQRYGQFLPPLEAYESAAYDQFVY